MGSDYVFPIGSASNYSPASFKLASGTVSDASIAIGLTEGQHSNITAPNYINRYWTFTPTGFTSPVYDASFTYVDADVVGTESTIISSKYSSGWTQHLLTTEASNLLTILGATSFSDYTGYGTLALTPSSYINPVCSGTVTTISAYASGNNGALSYTWSPSGSGASFDPNPALTTSTMFYVTVTDALGATQRSSVYVTVDARQSVRLNFNYNNLANSLLTSGITAGLYYADTLRSDLVITPASGQNYYEFTNMCPKTYVVRATSTTPTVGTINGTDAAQVNYWGTHPYAIEKVRFYAGDVVGPNNTLTSTDAQRINNNFVNGASLDRSGWSFWNAGETISNQIPTPTESYPSVTLSAGSTLTANMYGLISGDFNMSYSPAKSLTGGNVNLSYEGNLKTVNNQEISLPIHLVNQNTIGAASLVLNFPADLVQIEDVVMNSTEGQLDWAVKNNELRIGWYTSNPITFNAGEQLLTIRLKTSASFNATSPVQFTLAANSGNEIADENFEAINNAQITMAGINGTTIGLQGNLDGNSKLSLSNRPNPFSGNTTITYELPFDGNLSLEIFDYMGRSVQMLINENQLKGNHSLMFDAKSLAAGIYVARLSLSNDNNKIVRSIKLINNR